MLLLSRVLSGEGDRNKKVLFISIGGFAAGNSREAAKKARGACRPSRDELSIGKLQSFLPYFLYFTKSRKKKSPQGGDRLPQATQKGGAAADNSAKRKDLLRQQQKKVSKGGGKAAERQRI